MLHFDKKAINNPAELQHRIMQLNALKEAQEEKIARNLKEIYYSVLPEVLIKNMLNKVSLSTSATGAAKVGADYLIGRVFGRYTGIKGYIASLVLEKLTNYALNNQTTIFTSGINMIKKIFNKRPTKEFS